MRAGLFSRGYTRAMDPCIAAAVLVVLALVALALGARALAARGTRPGRSSFVPVRDLAPRPATPGADLTARGAAGTVAAPLYSLQSRISLERGVSAPSLAETPNPVSRIGTTSAVRAWGDVAAGAAVRARRTVWELQPGEPGFMERVNDDATSLLAALTRRSPATVAGRAACPRQATDVDADFAPDGLYDSAVLGGDAAFGRREALVSDRSGSRAAANALTGIGRGLGSVHRDPRFEPGPEARLFGGDYSPAPGSYAGGLSLGAYAPARFAPADAYYDAYVRGFEAPPAALATASE